MQGSKARWDNFNKRFKRHNKDAVVQTIIKSGTRVNMYRRAKTVGKILFWYFDLMMNSVLHGHKATFPGFGDVYIEKKKLLRPKVWKSAFVFNKNKNEQYCYNPLRPNLNYSFTVDAPILHKHGFRAFATYKWRQLLHKILTTTDRDYPMYTQPIST